MKGIRSTVGLLACLAGFSLIIAGCKSGENSKTTANARGIVLGEPEGNVSESGGVATIPVSLLGRPASTVTLHLESSDEGEGIVQTADLEFTPENWDAVQLAGIAGVEDAVADGDQGFTVTVTVSSDDSHYMKLPPHAVELVNQDDDQAGILWGVSATGPSEDGGAMNLNFLLSSQPYDDVVVHISSSDETEVVVSHETVIITPENWQSPPSRLFLTGVDDDLVDGDQVVVVTLDFSSSLDAVYAALPPTTRMIVNTDNDGSCRLGCYEGDY